MLNIDEIQNGIVIDHIKAGTAIGLMDLLGIKGNRTASVALIQNARSHKTECGRKDIIKVEGDSSWLNLDVLAYLDPNISVTIIKDVLEAKGIEYKETRSLEDSMADLDILYMTRVQKERFFNEEDYIRLKNSYILTKEKMALAKPHMAVLHPLPRVNEITLEVDDDPRAAYFEQVQNAVYIRMALIMTLLGLPDPKAPDAKEEH